MTTTVWCTFSFEALHLWDEAPEPVEFLRHPHRHKFEVMMEWRVNHNDRDREFILEGRRGLQYVNTLLQSQPTLKWSCETWAHRLRAHFKAHRVTVSEDGENGATVTL